MAASLLYKESKVREILQRKTKGLMGVGEREDEIHLSPCALSSLQAS